MDINHELEEAARQFLTELFRKGPKPFSGEGSPDVQLAYVAKEVVTWRQSMDLEIAKVQVERDKVEIERLKAVTDARSARESKTDEST